MKKGECNYTIGVKGSGVFDEKKLEFEQFDPVEIPQELSNISIEDKKK